jgi:hypothetical protein
LKSLHQ